MLYVPAEESVWVQLCDDSRVVNEVPIRKHHHLEVIDTTIAEFAKSKVNAFDNKHSVLVMTIHHHQLACTMACKLSDDVLHCMGQCCAIETGCSGEVIASS